MFRLPRKQGRCDVTLAPSRFNRIPSYMFDRVSLTRSRRCSSRFLPSGENSILFTCLSDFYNGLL